MEKIKNNVEDTNEIVDYKVEEVNNNIDDSNSRKTKKLTLFIAILIFLLCFWEVQYNNSMNHQFNRYNLLIPDYYYCLEANQYTETACMVTKVRLDLPSRSDFYWFGIMNIFEGMF